LFRFGTPFKRHWLLLVLVALLGTPAMVLAADIYVAPNGSDQNAGAAEQPWRTIQKAVDAAAAGDIVSIGAGVYHERVRVEKPLTLRGQSGVVLDGSVSLKAEWSKAGGDLDGVFIASAAKQPRGLLLDGKFIAEIRFDRAQAEGDWHWRTLLAKGPPLSGFGQIRALWMYHPDERRIYVRLENGASPDGLALSAVASKEPLLRIEKVQGVTVEGLAFAHGSTGIVVGEGAAECIIRHCRVTSFESTGIALGSGAARCVIEECDITRGSLEDWTPSLGHDRANYEIWRIHKDVGNYDRNGINIVRAGAGNRVLRNHLDRVFDGIALGDYTAESLDKPLPDPEHGRGAEIAGNTIENTRDSGIELGVGCADVEVHHNVLRRTHGGLRFKLPRLGPVFIHHNRLMDGAPFGIWFSMDASPARGYVYHNTIERGRMEALHVARDSRQRDFIAPHWHFVNNLVLNKHGFCEPSGKADFTVSHNAASASAAVDAGLDLSTYLDGKPLPGCPPGYFRGKAPDAGADESPLP